MDMETILVLLVGGGGIGAIVSAFFNRLDAKEKNEISLLERSQVEIERLDKRIDGLRKRLKEEKEENSELHNELARLKKARGQLKNTIRKLEKIGE